MTCPNCDCNIPDDSVFCTECGIKIYEYGLAENMMRCPSCKHPTVKNANFCTNCRAPLSQQAIDNTLKLASLEMQKTQIEIQNAAINLQKQQAEMLQKKLDSELKCPKCGSTSITGQKKGYGVVKGGLGALAVGAATGGIGAIIGLGAGNIGRKKIICTCMNCGHKFKAGRVK